MHQILLNVNMVNTYTKRKAKIKQMGLTSRAKNVLQTGVQHALDFCQVV